MNICDGNVVQAIKHHDPHGDNAHNFLKSTTNYCLAHPLDAVFVVLILCTIVQVLLGVDLSTIPTSFDFPTPLFPSWSMLSLPFAPPLRFLLYLSFVPVLGSLLLPPWLLPGVRLGGYSLLPHTHCTSCKRFKSPSASH